jgi:hypothetical protein
MRKIISHFLITLFASFQSKNFVLFAVTQNLLSGKSKGKIGNLVMTSWKNLNVLKSKPLEVRNPKTVAQTAQRVKFNLILQFFRNIASAVNIGFKQYTSDMSAYNKFMSTNLLIDGITSGDPQTIDYSKIIVAKGTLTGFSNLTNTPTVGHSVEVRWDDNSGQGNALATDLFKYVAFNETKNEFSTISHTTPRGDTVEDVSTANWDTGDTVHIWCFFASADLSIVSDSAYLTAELL